MAGANNKSAKGLGYSAKQIETVRKSGGILSHAALMAHGAPAKPTKAYKALAADMAERKKGLTRKAEPPAGWKAAARGEGKAGRDAATAARAAFVAKRDSAKGGNLDLRKQTERRYELTERLRAKTDDLREARRSAMNSGDDARVAKLDSQIKRMTARADRADEGWTRMGTALNAAPAEKRQQWEAKADRAEKRKAIVARTAQSLGGVSKIARGMRQKQVKAQQAAAAFAAGVRGPATARLQKLRTLRQESNAARDAWVTEARKANPGGDITTFTPAMKALGKVSTQKRSAYEAASARSTKEMNAREDSTRAIAVRFQRVADRTSRKADAARAAGDSAAADRLAARAKDLYRRRNEAFKRAERYSTTSMSYERLSRLKR